MWRQWLREGIEAAKAGDKARARLLLERVLEVEEGCVQAWLWLSGVVDDLEERLVCLENVLDLDPQNELANRGILRVKRQLAEQWRKEGLAALEAGDPLHARELLGKIVEIGEDDAEIWYALSRANKDPDERVRCLENVLVLDPHHAQAQEDLARIRAELAREKEESRERSFASPAAKLLDEGKPPIAPEEFVPKAPEAPEEDLFSDPYRCPYCAAPTRPEDPLCPSCGNPLVERVLKLEKPSVWFWVLVVLQSASVIFGIMGIFLAVFMTAVLTYGPTPDALDHYGEMLKAYFNFAALWKDLPETPYFDLFPPLFFWGAWFGVGVSSLLVVMTLSRKRWVYYFLVAGQALNLVVTIALIAMGVRLALCTVFSLLVGVLLLLQVEGDFAYEEVRLSLKPARGCSLAVDYLAAGRRYARQEMWALAALHLRRAAALLPEQPGILLELAYAYARIRHYDLALRVLEQARQLAPEDPRGQEMIEVVRELKRRDEEGQGAEED